jgi:hypothetical protein
MRDLAWDDVKDMFDPLANGTLPDVRVDGTNLDDWQSVLDLAKDKSWRYEYEEFRPYTAGNVEFDVDLREVQGQDGIDRLCALFRTLGRLLGKPVRMYPEGGTTANIAYQPDEDRVVNLVSPERRQPPAATDR